MSGKYIPEHQLFLPQNKDSIYLVKPFKEGLGIFYLKSDITLPKLLDNKYELREFGKSGLIDAKGNILLPREFDQITIYSKQLVKVKAGKLFRLYNLDKKEFISKEYEYIGIPQGNLVEVQNDAMHGVMDLSGREIIPLVYSNFLLWSFADFIAAQKEGKYGVLTKDGKSILPFQYDYVSGLEDQIIAKDRNGYIIYNTKAEKLVDTTFIKVQSFLSNKQYIPVFDNHKFHVYDLVEKKAVSDLYQEIFDLSGDKDGFYRILDEMNYGVLDDNFKVKIPAEYNLIGGFREGLAIIKKEDKIGYINENFEIVIPIQFDDAVNFFDGMAKVSLDGKYGYINMKGEFLFEAGLREVGFFYRGLARKIFQNKYGFVDKAGFDLIPPQFDWADTFEYSSAVLVLKNGKLFFIDTDGNIVQ